MAKKGACDGTRAMRVYSGRPGSSLLCTRAGTAGLLVALQGCWWHCRAISGWLLVALQAHHLWMAAGWWWPPAGWRPTTQLIDSASGELPGEVLPHVSPV